MTLGLLAETKTLENLEKHRRQICSFRSEIYRSCLQVRDFAPSKARVLPPAATCQAMANSQHSPGAFTPLSSEVVSALRVKECPVQMEAVTRNIYPLKGDSRLQKLGGGAAVEVEILRVHVREDFVMKENYVDPEKWRPLIYNFRHYFGLGEELGSTFRAEV
jgi:hypothetical protein